MYPTILQLIDAADTEGVLRFTYPKYLNHLLETSRMEALASMVERELFNAGFIRGVIGRGRWAEHLQAQATKNADEAWEVRINLAKTFLLPGNDPAAELAELRKFFSRIQEGIATAGTDRLVVAFINERDSHRRVAGAFEPKCIAESVQGPGPKAAADLKADLNAQLEGSVLLRGFMKNMGLALSKIGTWSWWTCGEDQMFPEGDGPVRKHLNDQAAAKYRAAATQQASGASAAASGATP
ncbi:hypothetical protein ABIC83_002521 [Roseateles asaccharophilus]|uniref:hypothetical protein n=1 Tax=Roseateles asaccharophilus TaxID=582607 RepID=UPI003836E823